MRPQTDQDPNENSEPIAADSRAHERFFEVRQGPSTDQSAPPAPDRLLLEVLGRPRRGGGDADSSFSRSTTPFRRTLSTSSIGTVIRGPKRATLRKATLSKAVGRSAGDAPFNCSG